MDILYTTDNLFSLVYTISARLLRRALKVHRSRALWFRSNDIHIIHCGVSVCVYGKIRHSRRIGQQLARNQAHQVNIDFFTSSWKLFWIAHGVLAWMFWNIQHKIINQRFLTKFQCIFVFFHRSFTFDVVLGEHPSILHSIYGNPKHTHSHPYSRTHIHSFQLNIHTVLVSAYDNH